MATAGGLTLPRSSLCFATMASFSDATESIGSEEANTANGEKKKAKNKEEIQNMMEALGRNSKIELFGCFYFDNVCPEKN